MHCKGLVANAFRKIDGAWYCFDTFGRLVA